MQYKKIPNTDLEVSRIGLGTWAFGDKTWGLVAEKNYLAVVDEAIGLGINLIDTAPIYGMGKSEELVGRALKGKRNKVVLATKCGLRGESGRISEDLSAKFILKEIEDSLKRLQVEHIDLYQCHWPDEDTSIEETMKALEQLQKQGKVRYIGVSNFKVDLIEESLKFTQIATTQNHYSLLERSIENELYDFCFQKNIGILTYGSLGGGILSGKYKQAPNFKPSDARSFFYKFYKGKDFQKAYKVVGLLEEISSLINKPPAEIALNWLVNKPAVSSVLVGSKTVEQIRSNANAGCWNLSPEDIERLNAARPY